MGRRPFGYDADMTSIRPAEAVLVREAADRVLAGESLRAVCKSWNARPVATTVLGTKWSPMTLRRMLMSARISGRRERYTIDGVRRPIGTIVADAVWPGIIDVDQSDRLRHLFGNPARRINSYTAEYLLTGGDITPGVGCVALHSWRIPKGHRDGEDHGKRSMITKDRASRAAAAFVSRPMRWKRLCPRQSLKPSMVVRWPRCCIVRRTARRRMAWWPSRASSENWPRRGPAIESRGRNGTPREQHSSQGRTCSVESSKHHDEDGDSMACPIRCARRGRHHGCRCTVSAL